MTLSEATRQYWRYSQHYAALSPSERSTFLTFTIAPQVATHKSQHMRHLLARLMNRVEEEAQSA